MIVSLLKISDGIGLDLRTQRIQSILKPDLDILLLSPLSVIVADVSEG